MSDTRNRTVCTGYGIGWLVALVLSWCLNHSVGWAIVHSLCGWIYLLYAAIARTDEVVAGAVEDRMIFTAFAIASAFVSMLVCAALDYRRR